MRIRPSMVLAVVVSLVAVVRAQPKMEEKLETQKLTDTLYLVTGPGGNIAVLVGKTGLLLVDTQVPPMSAKLKQTLAQISPKPVRLVINTHWHFDHTGGNPVFGGDGAVIVAHDNVRKRVSTEQFMKLFNRRMPPIAPDGWPAITFAQSISFHVDDEDVDVFHVDRAHTDGDSIVYFRKANVIHTGDTFVSAGYPFVDLSSGGTSDGVFQACDRVLAMAQPKTRIIPGHGPVSDAAKVKAFRGMLWTIRDRVRKQVVDHKSLADIQAAKLTADFDGAWGNFFIKGSQLVETFFTELTPAPAAPVH
jgi:glyoxylase-like metal-dependent hydrolase (beta-lactamase superfamily II)